MNRERLADAALALVFGLALFYSASNFAARRSDVILGEHSFRQTQTALTTYWFLRDGFRLAYPTPVIGTPWSVPFELPAFQAVTALVVKLGRLRIDTAGRSVSYFFCLATLWPMWMLCGALRLPSRFFFIGGAMYLASPIYLFWGNAFLMETLALFLTLLFLVCAIKALFPAGSPDRRWPVLAGLAATGLLAGNVKVTTFAPAAILVAGMAALAAADAYRRHRWTPRELLGSSWVWVFAVLGAIYGSMSLWVGFTDGIKAQGEIGRRLVSANLMTWNFGTLRQHVGAALWVDTIWSRAVVETIGPGLWLVVGVALVGVYTRRELAYICGAVSLFLGTFVLFPNLHIVHNYYQCANAIYLIFAAAIVLASMGPRTPAGVVCAAAVVVALQIQTFRHGYLKRELALSDSVQRTLQVADAVKSSTGSDSAILVFGYDWSSEIAYYSERKAATVPNWQDLPSQAAENPRRFLGSADLSAVVVCPGADSSDRFATALGRLTRGAHEEQRAGCTIYTALSSRAEPRSGL